MCLLLFASAPGTQAIYVKRKVRWLEVFVFVLSYDFGYCVIAGFAHSAAAGANKVVVVVTVNFDSFVLGGAVECMAPYDAGFEKQLNGVVDRSFGYMKSAPSLDATVKFVDREMRGLFHDTFQKGKTFGGTTHVALAQECYKFVPTTFEVSLIAVIAVVHNNISDINAE